MADSKQMSLQKRRLGILGAARTALEFVEGAGATGDQSPQMLGISTPIFAFFALQV